MLGVRGAQLVEHRVERCGDLLARGIRRQGRRVRRAGSGPDPLDGPSIVEVLADEARDLLDERRSGGGKGLDLGGGAKVEAQQAEQTTTARRMVRVRPRESSHGRTASRVDDHRIRLVVPVDMRLFGCFDLGEPD